MLRVNLFGNTFNHNLVNNKITSTLGKAPNYIEFVLDGTGSINLFVDRSIYDANKINNGKKNYAWIIESNIAKDLIPHLEKIYLSEKNIFELIFTHSQKLLSLSTNFKFLHPIGYWVKDDLNIKKTKLISMILSDKKFTSDQKKRVKYANLMKNNIDIFGSGFHPIKNKEIGLVNYCYSIAFENCISDDYFSEKILDCFATKTIPIYSGTKNISKYFDPKGIIFFEDFNFNKLNFELYEKKIDAINYNFEICKNYKIPEDSMFKNYLS